MDFVHADPVFDPDITKSTEHKKLTEVDYKEVVLFRTKFVNNSKENQSYKCRAERQTKSSYTFSVQKGYTVGTRVNLELPTKIISAVLSRSYKVANIGIESFYNSKKLPPVGLDLMITGSRVQNLSI